MLHGEGGVIKVSRITWMVPLSLKDKTFESSILIRRTWGTKAQGVIVYVSSVEFIFNETVSGYIKINKNFVCYCFLKLWTMIGVAKVDN